MPQSQRSPLFSGRKGILGRNENPSSWGAWGEEVASLTVANLPKVPHWHWNVLIGETVLKSCPSRMSSDRKSPREK